MLFAFAPTPTFSSFFRMASYFLPFFLLRRPDPLAHVTALTVFSVAQSGM